MTDLSNPIFHDEEAARAHMENIRWPDGPYCPHCGETEEVHRLEGKAHRPGLLYCRSCRKQFSVTVGTVYERSKVPLHKWVLATQLLASSKKGMSAHQLHRMLGVTYKTAWFMAHRIREGMRDPNPSPLGGTNKVVEADETFMGGKEKNKPLHKRKRRQHGGRGKGPVFSLVERDGKVRSFHVADVTAKTLKPSLKVHVDRATFLMTDDSLT